MECRILNVKNGMLVFNVKNGMQNSYLIKGPDNPTCEVEL